MNKLIHLPNTTQRGAVTLIMTIVLLFAMTMVTIYTAKVSITEQRISNNEVTSTQAYEYAVAGIEQGIESLTRARVNLFNGADQELLDELDTTANEDAPFYKVSYDNNDLNDDGSILRITSTGVSEDGSSTFTVELLVATRESIPNIPPVATLSHGQVSITGNTTIANLTPATSNVTIWSGGQTGCTAAAANIAPGNNVPACSNSAGICAGDPVLSSMTSDDFFVNFFGVPFDDYPGTRVSSTTELVTALGSGERVIIYTPPTTSSRRGGSTPSIGPSVAQSIGTLANPVILIVKGDLRVTGNTDIFGLLYTTGNLDHAGNGAITGSTIAAGDINLTGTPNLTYNQAVIDDLTDNTNTTMEPVIVPIAGSWKGY